MKPVIERAILALIFFGMAASVAFAQEEATPIAKVETTVVDIGTVANGQEIPQSFTISNEGTMDLVLTQVRPTCGCTVADYDEVIAPGETGQVRAVLDTTNFNGAISKTIIVTTNDPGNPEITLAIKATVRPYVAVDPGYARFIAYVGAVDGSVSQLVWADDFPEEFEITRVESPLRFIETSFRLATDEERNTAIPARQWIVETTLRSSKAQVGALAKHIVVHTNHPKQTQVKIPLSGFIRPMFFVSPEKANFGAIELTEPRRLGLDVRNFSETVHELTEIDGLPEGMEAEIKMIGQDNHRFQVILTATPEMPKGSFDTVIKIHTSSEFKPVLEVPISGSVL